nr:MAG TPA: hypothetical protein [Caudoviricetes sp.]DAV81431.1 MAG TPA: hypothetical protein [Caudoviricetes sp.]
MLTGELYVLSGNRIQELPARGLILLLSRLMLSTHNL